MNLFALDDWLIDRVFQAAADWLANWRITTTHVASLCFVIAPGCEIASVTTITIGAAVPEPKPIPSALTQATIHAIGLFPTTVLTLIGLATLLIYPLVHCYLAIRDGSSNRNIWLMPAARLEFLPVRVMWLLLTLSSAVSAYFDEGWWFVGYGGALVTGHYFWACRRRPPSRRRAAAPDSSSTERAS